MRSVVLRLLLVVLVAVAALGPTAGPAAAERAGLVDPSVFAPGEAFDAGRVSACASGTYAGGPQQTRCWGFSSSGLHGQPPSSTVLAPNGIRGGHIAPLGAPLDLALGREHACAVLLGGTVTCWGEGDRGQLGYASTASLGGDQAATGGPVDLGPGRTATAVTAGDEHSCALLDDGAVRCWGMNLFGWLGSGDAEWIGDDETPGSVPPVDLGPGRTARAISAAGNHTCAILDTGDVRCWGLAGARLGRGDGSAQSIGDDETPGSVPPVDLGPGRTARAISVGLSNTCVILDTGQVLCWGDSDKGQLGSGNLQSVGDDETPGSVPPVDLGPGRTATSISISWAHSCAVLDTGDVRCWGFGGDGRLGLGTTKTVGDDEPPTAVPPVDLAGARARTVSAGNSHTCAELTDSIACWGYGMAIGATDGTIPAIGDDETPGRVRVDFRGDRTLSLPPDDPSPPLGVTALGIPVEDFGFPPPPPVPLAPTIPTPTRGVAAVADPTSGTVLVKTTPGGSERRLRRGERVPVGTVLDTTKGAVKVTTADGRGGTQSARFFDGRFRLRQGRGAALTVAELVEPLRCPALAPISAAGRGKASSAERRRARRKREKARKERAKAKRGLWGDGKGRFRTDGEHGTASVKGTRWYVEDRCDGTLVKVARGTIQVRDDVRGGTFSLRAGEQRYLPARRSARPTVRPPATR